MVRDVILYIFIKVAEKMCLADNNIIVRGGIYMTIILLIVSIILILFWGIIDRGSLKKLSGAVRFAIFTYLLALLAFIPLQYTSENVEINAICSIVGAAFTAITIFCLALWISTVIRGFNFSGSLKTFLNSVISIVMFLIAGALMMNLSILQPVRNYIAMALIAIIAVLGVVAIYQYSLLLLNYYLGQENLMNKMKSNQTRINQISKNTSLGV
ncbi:hypothetical protein [Lactobacillus selangorensis]|uniref:Uncharacterized protein n=2 Tax=Lactobacillus selangorensis TaxID=81857 RepID=A0A0R2FW10_9LACO|nr:hypothetical protein [Lactobacillus selangorensis]KRN29076.1 hypothetical protein IV40_GL000597 [Lactobacillus selangorensis]